MQLVWNGIHFGRRCTSRRQRCSSTTSIWTTRCGTPAMPCRSMKTGRISRALNGAAQRILGVPRPDSYPDWLDQIWFAGVHSDIGGGYAENESRLSEITLAWMVHAAANLPDGNTPNGAG